MHLGHRCDYDDGHDSADDNKEQADLVQQWQQTIPEHYKRAARPGYEDESDVDVPWLDDEVGVEHGVHLHGYIGGNGDNRGEIEYPTEKVKRAGEEAKDAAVAGSGGDGRPVVDTTGGGDRRGELKGNE